MTVILNQIPNDPQLSDLLALWQRQIMLSLNCHHIGTIGAFNPANQTATVSINYTRTYFQVDDVSGDQVPVQVNYPLLLECPVVCLGGGTGSITFPILPGDECIVMFNDRDIDNWFTGAPAGPVNSNRLHAISDGIALVGVRSMAHVLTSYDSTNIVLQLTGGTKVTIGQNGSFTVTGLFGSFSIAATGEIKFSSGPAGVTVDITASGQVKMTNLVGELIQSIFNLFTTATAGGFSLVLSPTDLATLTSFV